MKVIFDPNGDTRTAVDTSKEAFDRANISHISDVQQAMVNVAQSIIERGQAHDYTKFQDEFYQDFINTLTTGSSFVDGKWYKNHIQVERHHLNNHCPEDVDLVDVIEMICDCVCAARARSNKKATINISSDILQKAVENTVESLDRVIQVVDLTSKTVKEETPEITEDIVLESPSPKATCFRMD